MGFDVGLWGAFLGGLLSFVSPCVLPLVPPYLCYIAGVSLDELTAAEGRTAGRVLGAAAAFVAGFSTVFVLLGATASVLGRLVAQHLPTLTIISGVLIILMGLHFLGVFRIGLLAREARVQVTHKPSGFVGAYVMGLAFAFGWTPCIGPVLAAILLVAGSAEMVASGAGLLAVYSLGMGVPFLIVAGFVGPSLAAMRRLRRHLGTVERIMGALLVLTGILFLTGQMSAMSFWLLETFPVLGTLG